MLPFKIMSERQEKIYSKPRPVCTGYGIPFYNSFCRIFKCVNNVCFSFYTDYGHGNEPWS